MTWAKIRATFYGERAWRGAFTAGLLTRLGKPRHRTEPYPRGKQSGVLDDGAAVDDAEEAAVDGEDRGTVGGEEARDVVAVSLPVVAFGENRPSRLCCALAGLPDFFLLFFSLLSFFTACI